MRVGGSRHVTLKRSMSPKMPPVVPHTVPLTQPWRKSKAQQVARRQMVIDIDLLSATRVDTTPHEEHELVVPEDLSPPQVKIASSPKYNMEDWRVETPIPLTRWLEDRRLYSFLSGGGRKEVSERMDVVAQDDHSLVMEALEAFANGYQALVNSPLKQAKSKPSHLTAAPQLSPSKGEIPTPAAPADPAVMVEQPGGEGSSIAGRDEGIRERRGRTVMRSAAPETASSPRPSKAANERPTPAIHTCQRSPTQSCIVITMDPQVTPKGPAEHRAPSMRGGRVLTSLRDDDCDPPTHQWPPPKPRISRLRWGSADIPLMGRMPETALGHMDGVAEDPHPHAGFGSPPALEAPMASHTKPSLEIKGHLPEVHIPTAYLIPHRRLVADRKERVVVKSEVDDCDLNVAPRPTSADSYCPSLALRHGRLWAMDHHLRTGADPVLVQSPTITFSQPPMQMNRPLSAAKPSL
eukprot:GGOE01044559.1.p1 GENE.GGOE01044559.1~~GGOE01044559.1.p1  ORF type:complete len:464 (-),score=46.50 GGOE01044559.1:243-1634(-)